MSYVFSKVLDTDLQTAKDRITAALKEEGFGILTEINMQKTLESKLGVEMRPYIILGACNPGFAYKAVSAEKHIGSMLPCNVILREEEDGKIEVSAIDPVASMQAVKNDALGEIAAEVRDKIQKAVENC